LISYRQGVGSDTAVVSFVIEPAPEYSGGAIAVVGDFNGWDPSRHEFAPGDDGRWRVNVELHTGRHYAFRYVTESGHWFDEPDAHGHQDNGVGQADCILDLTGPTEPAPRPAGLDLDAIRARVQAATAGPWERHGCDVLAAGQPVLRGRDGDPIQRRQADLDAEFVAHARTDITTLLAALDATTGAPPTAERPEGRGAHSRPARGADSPAPARFQLRSGLDGARAMLYRQNP
jgi:hypothetical protein